MAAPKLNKDQKATVLRLLAEGETHARIAQEVGCSPDGVKYYAVTYSEEIEKARLEFNNTIMKQGFAGREYRVRKLDRLARRIEERLEASLDATDTKLAANGDTVEVTYFNTTEVNAYFKAMEDIAKELGERKTKTEVSGPDGQPLFKVYQGVDVDKV